MQLSTGLILIYILGIYLAYKQCDRNFLWRGGAHSMAVLWPISMVVVSLFYLSCAIESYIWKLKDLKRYRLSKVELLPKSNNKE